MSHIVLLGDSVFDNAAYVGGGPDVVRQLQSLLSPPWRASLLARDGATTAGIPAQLERLPPEATHLVLSVGGNDAIQESGVLEQRSGSVAESVERIAAARDRFAQNYRRVLDRIAERQLPAAVCTIYEARFPDPLRRRIAAAALAVLNDSITRQAFARGLTLIDLRVICDSDADFANPIEPSVQGGMKIAKAIREFALPEDQRASRVIAR